MDIVTCLCFFDDQARVKQVLTHKYACECSLPPFLLLCLYRTHTHTHAYVHACTHPQDKHKQTKHTQHKHTAHFDVNVLCAYAHAHECGEMGALGDGAL